MYTLLLLKKLQLSCIVRSKIFQLLGHSASMDMGFAVSCSGVTCPQQTLEGRYVAPRWPKVIPRATLK